ncbi:hypothetical protein V6U71_07400 [Sphingopyxis sp. J-6]|uniref:hypothetical protein n=1 Tax=Sphingopyxis sp. J-6 TaxID=3122054 RepID=UPI003984603F
MNGDAPPMPERLTVGRLTISGASRIEARRIADALPAALARVATSGRAGPVPVDPRASAADRVAAEIWRQVAPRVEQGR